MQLIVNCGVLICAMLLMISGLLMAWFIPADWVGGALGFARTTHLLASHWYYIFMSFHIGLHGAMIASKMKIHGLVPHIIYILISLYGIYAFITRGIWKYMFGLQQFFFFDFETAVVFIEQFVFVFEDGCKSNFYFPCFPRFLAFFYKQSKFFRAFGVMLIKMKNM